MLKKDSIWMGAVLGIVLPALLYLLLYLVGSLLEPGSIFSRPIQGNNLYLMSLVINLVTMRIYFVNLKKEKTGRGILLATFLLVLAFFIFFKNI